MQSDGDAAVDSGEAQVSPEAQDLLLTAPFHRFLDLRMLRYGEGYAEILLPFREELVSDPDVPYIHGGIIAALLDIAGDYAIASQLGRGVPTIDMRVDFLKTAGREHLIGIGRVLKLGRSVGVTDAEVLNAQRQVIAVGRILYSTR